MLRAHRVPFLPQPDHHRPVAPRLLTLPIHLYQLARLG